MYWACARLELHRERIAQHFLQLAGFETYLPRLRERRRRNGRVIERRPLLFPSYGFVLLVDGWWQARWCAGVAGLIMNGAQPACVADSIIDEIRSRERDELVELAPRLQRGDQVRILRGPFREQLALYQGQAPHERVAVLLSLLGGQRRITVPKDDVEPM